MYTAAQNKPVVRIAHIVFFERVGCIVNTGSGDNRINQYKFNFCTLFDLIAFITNLQRQ